MNQYEAMFLFDPTFGNSFEKCEAEIRRLMERAQAEIILCRKWDERRLTYRIKGRKRGVYVLTYFQAPSDTIASLERDAKLSENILRVLVIRADGLAREAMEDAFRMRGGEPAKAGGRGGQAAASGAVTEEAAKEATAVADESPSVTAKTAVADLLEDEVIETE